MQASGIGTQSFNFGFLVISQFVIALYGVSNLSSVAFVTCAESTIVSPTSVPLLLSTPIILTSGANTLTVTVICSSVVASIRSKSSSFPLPFLIYGLNTICPG